MHKQQYSYRQHHLQQRPVGHPPGCGLWRDTQQQQGYRQHDSGKRMRRHSRRLWRKRYYLPGHFFHSAIHSHHYHHFVHYSCRSGPCVTWAQVQTVERESRLKQQPQTAPGVRGQVPGVFLISQSDCHCLHSDFRFCKNSGKSIDSLLCLLESKLLSGLSCEHSGESAPQRTRHHRQGHSQAVRSLRRVAWSGRGICCR